MQFHEKLPCDESAERAILGSVIVDPDNLSTVLEKLREDDFCNEDHKILFSLILDLWHEHGNKWDVVILNDYIRKKNLETRLPPDWIDELMDEAVGPETLEHVCQIVKEKSARRSIIELGIELIHKAREVSDFYTLIEDAQMKIFNIAEGATPTQFYHVKEVAEKVIELIDKFKNSERVVTGISSGFIELDIRTTGFHPGDLIILAARPGMGKTAFMLSVAYNIASQEDKPVAIFSLEMSKEQLVMRLLSLISEIPLFKIRSGTISEDEMKKLEAAALELSKYDIYLDDTPALTTTDLRIRARKLKKEKEVEFIAVDYLQLLRPPVRKQSRQEEVAEVSRNLKALAKELNIPVMALAQLSREVEKRSDKRPQLADLRESGQIEQDADLILFLHRPDYYKKKPSPEEQGIAELIIAKQRQGPTDIIKLAFVKEFTKFSNLEVEEPEKEEEDISEILDTQEEEEELDIDF
ncbi:replicative DNA helicase [Aquifex sp.]